ncbi:NagC family transcriptional regulator [Thermocladium modestius]|uniref:Nascent polypeptide-associated complex protein n=1 Tax=Thermocladium modestius TaxID=62609 RepID=A0A830GX60_9CREN|nr:nascent polypeptide-associated complex protein [Thermocladium modestius]GGP21480.1 NagC family transcriptional regulator [Thermocladium modestius]
MINPNELRKMLKRMGVGNLNVEELSAAKVVIYLRNGSVLEVPNPNVAAIKMQGMVIYQVQASERDVKATSSPQQQAAPAQSSIIMGRPPTAPEPAVSEDDVRLIMDQTGATRDEAVKALRESGGDLAEAILKLQSKKQ